jgi:hypothetical protein
MAIVRSIAQSEENLNPLENRLLMKIDKVTIGLICSSNDEWEAVKERLCEKIRFLGDRTQHIHEGWVNRKSQSKSCLKYLFKRRRTYRIGETLIEIYHSQRRYSQYHAVIRVTNQGFHNGDQQHVYACLSLHHVLKRLCIRYRLSPLDERCEITLDSPNQELHDWMSKRMVLKWTTRHKVLHWEKVTGEWEDGHHPEGQNCYLTDDRRSTARVYAAYIDDRVRGKYRTLEMRSDQQFLEDHSIRTIEDFINRTPDLFLSYVQLLELDIAAIFRWQDKYKKQSTFSGFYRSSKREWERMAAECTSLEIINRLAELFPGMKRTQITQKFLCPVELPPVATAFIRDKEEYKNFNISDHFST